MPFYAKYFCRLINLSLFRIHIFHYFVFGHDYECFVDKHFDSKIKYSEDDYINRLSFR